MYEVAYLSSGLTPEAKMALKIKMKYTCDISLVQ